MSLPLPTIDRIFARLLVRYGAAWLRMWPEGVDENAIKADWANELGGLSNGAIFHALNHLPTDRPPTVGQFRLLCIGRPEIFKALDAPKPTPEEKERVRQMLAKARASITRGAA